MHNSYLDIIFNSLLIECKIKQHKANLNILKDLTIFKYSQVNCLHNLYICLEELEWEDEKIVLHKKHNYNWIIWILVKNNILRDIDKTVYMLNPAFLIDKKEEYLNGYTLGKTHPDINANISSALSNWSNKSYLIRQERDRKLCAITEEKNKKELINDIRECNRINTVNNKKIQDAQKKRNNKLNRLYSI